MVTALCEYETVALSAIVERMDHQSGDTFSHDDRKELYKQGAKLEILMSAFDKLKDQLHENDAPTSEEFGRLAGKVESLQNFRWYLMGGAMVFGLFGHLLLAKVGL